ncbi:hypothetical protein [Streptomyces sp. NRRL S-350]|uniref:hypothetical protein n=1 Tax=Streptomyces sp. NRRL S-350 TaxID=1463902 RepID=UPI00131A64C2|nr:hypothetical protein [Streptomyces sp. NRRL S-350]
MRISELLKRLEEQQQRVGNVEVGSLLSSEWEGAEGPVVGVKADRGHCGSGPVTVLLEGRNDDEDTPQAHSEHPLTVRDLIARLTALLESTGDVDVKLLITGEDPYGGELGPITEVSALRWASTTLDGATDASTTITISGPIER